MSAVDETVGGDPEPPWSRVAVPAVASRVAAELRRQLIEGRLKPGERLSEPALCEQFRISRNTLREAFAELGGERLVVRQPSRGVFVASPDLEDLRDFYTVRRAIEVSAARNGGTPEQVARVAEAVAAGRRAAGSGDLDALASANQEFHRRIVQMSGSRRLDALMDQVLAEMRLFFHKESVDVGFYTRYLEDNEKIAQLLAQTSFDRAADLLGDDLARSEEHLVEIYSQQAASAPKPRRRGRPPKAG